MDLPKFRILQDELSYQFAHGVSVLVLKRVEGGATVLD